jgi:predicted KAP-like P-loop ATPase
MRTSTFRPPDFAEQHEAEARRPVPLVVFVDDLDRCPSSTVIGTLEAMRLFLFMTGRR